MKYITFLLLLVSSFSFASITSQDLDSFNNLTESQKAEVVKQIAAYSDSTTPGTTAKGVQEAMKTWGEIGAGIGVMLVNTAHELGIAANEFAQTPLGKTAIIVGLTYMFGAKVIGVFAWFACWFLFIPALWLSYNHFAYETTIEKKLMERKFLWVFPLYETKVVRRDRDSDNNILALHLIAAAGFFVTGIVML